MGLFRQTVRDFCVNQQFRKDYWVKGARQLTPLDQAEALRAERVILAVPRGNVNMKVNGSLGEANLQEAIYAPILDALADHAPKTLAQLEQAVKNASIHFAQLLQAVMVLSGMGALLPAQEETAVNKARKRTDRLNQHLMLKARSSNELNYLASPVTGGGISVARFHQMFLLARSHGHKHPADWAQYAWNILSMQGQRIMKEGKALESSEQNLAELKEQAEAFSTTHLPVLKALHIA